MYQVLVPVLVGAGLLSSIGSDKTSGEGGTYYVGATGWFIFCLTLVITAVFSIVQLARLFRGSTGTDVAVSNSTKESV